MSAAFFVVAALGAQAHAQTQAPAIQPGEWKITTKTMMNGAVTPPTVRTRCFTAEQARETAKTFGPQFGTVNSTCAEPAIETTDKSVKWRLICRGQMNMDVAANFDFESETHYKAVVLSKAEMGGQVLSNSMTETEGERTGDCQR